MWPCRRETARSTSETASRAKLIERRSLICRKKSPDFVRHTERNGTRVDWIFIFKQALVQVSGRTKLFPTETVYEMIWWPLYYNAKAIARKVCWRHQILSSYFAYLSRLNGVLFQHGVDHWRYEPLFFDTHDREGLISNFLPNTALERSSTRNGRQPDFLLNRLRADVDIYTTGRPSILLL